MSFQTLAIPKEQAPAVGRMQQVPTPVRRLMRLEISKTER